MRLLACVLAAIPTAVLAGAPAPAPNASQGATTYVAELRPVNDSLTAGSPAGQVELVQQGDSLQIRVDATGLPPGMRLMHYHGHPDGKAGACPTAADDRNQDGVVDLLEAVERAGKTLVPFHAQPASLEIKADTYPAANAAGALSYLQSVPLGELRKALEKQHGIRDLQLDKRVVLIHGVAAERKLPSTAQSLPGVPAEVTVPIACGTLARK